MLHFLDISPKGMEATSADLIYVPLLKQITMPIHSLIVAKIADAEQKEDL